MALVFAPGKDATVEQLDTHEAKSVVELLSQSPLSLVVLSRHMGAWQGSCALNPVQCSCSRC